MPGVGGECLFKNPIGHSPLTTGYILRTLFFQLRDLYIKPYYVQEQTNQDGYGNGQNNKDLVAGT
jgi:hypothetical protein